MDRDDLSPLSGRRLHAAELPESGGELLLSPEASRHAQVLRLREGDPVALFDGCGRVAEGRVERVERQRVTCRVGPPRVEGPRGPRLVLVQASPKGKKVDTIVRMATELGIDALLLATAERSVGRLEAGRAPGRLDRLEKIALEAARQAERATVPTLEAVTGLVEAASRAPAGALRLCFWARGGQPLRALIPDGLTPEEVWLVVGPEGGLTEAELRGLDALGYARARLGASILRAETAAVAAVAAVASRLSDEGGPRALNR